MRGFVREFLITLGVAAVIFLLFRSTANNSIVDGTSMLPGLEDGQRLIVVTAVYHFESPQRGDVVVIHPPVEPQQYFVKRIIGLPGDTIEVKRGAVYIDSMPLDEPYIKEKPRYTFAPVKIPDNNYFVLGDNRNDSEDSHFGWTVTRDNIIGEAWLRYWPLGNWGIVHGYPLSEELQNNSQKQANLIYGEIAWP
jgi:signal peptidase I